MYIGVAYTRGGGISIVWSRGGTYTRITEHDTHENRATHAQHHEHETSTTTGSTATKMKDPPHKGCNSLTQPHALAWRLRPPLWPREKLYLLTKTSENVKPGRNKARLHATRVIV